MSNWTLNGTPLATLGLTLAQGGFRTQGISYMAFDSARGFDAAEVFAFNAAVTLSKDAAPFFSGRIKPIRKGGSSQYEGHDYVLEDAWAELEATPYQEQWKIGVGDYYFPRAVLGLTRLGVSLTVGGQIREVIAYAISQAGIALTMGACPDGETVWPEEVSNVSCAEVIKMSLKLHPDWIPWLNHATVPPTFNVTKASELTALVLATDGSGALSSFSATRRDDLLPDSVRIVYEYATTIDDEVYRNAVIDKWPAGGPDAGPRVICATIPLAGGTMQMQKSRVRTRTMPDNAETGTLAKNWLKKVYPQLKNVPNVEFEVTSFEKSLTPDTDPHPDEINTRAARLIPDDADDIPNQLLDGQIEDWMRKKVGMVDFKAVITAAAGASGDTLAAIQKGFPPGRVQCTNAITKLYKGITQWAAQEDAPVGIAQGVYESLHAAYLWEGTATLAEAELSNYSGRALTLTGAGVASAPISEIDWDVGSGTTELRFGPPPSLAPADFLELQRILRARKVTWWSGIERADNKLGAAAAPSAAGDTVTGYQQPSLTFEPSSGVGSGGLADCAFGEIITVGADTAISGGVIYCGDKTFAVEPKVLALGTPGAWLVFVELDCTSNRDDDNVIFLPGIKTSTDAPTWEVKAWVSGTDYDDNVLPTVSTGVGTIRIPIGKLTIAASVATLEKIGCGNITITQCAGILSHERG